MSTQQLRVNINDLVNHIKNEDMLQACYLVIATFAKEDKKQRKNKSPKARPYKNNKDFESPLKIIKAEEGEEKPISHDLSFAFLANSIFKESLPLPEDANLAFNDALMESALKTPTLPNRL